MGASDNNVEALILPCLSSSVFAYGHVNPNADHPASTAASSLLRFSDLGIQEMDSNLLGIAGWA